MEPTKNSKGPVVIIALVILALIIAVVIMFSRNNSSTTSVENIQENTKPTNTATSSNQTAETKSYTLAEVSPHNSAADCWMAIEGEVYNVTAFVNKHPGGKAILNGCGKDATILFNERPTNNRGPHPSNAKAALEQFLIGNFSS